MGILDGDTRGLGKYRVLDLTDEKGYLCGKILGDLGADVIKIEPPGGDPGRQKPPFYTNKEGSRQSLYWAAYNTSKSSCILDIAADKDRTHLTKLAGTADILIESFTPGYMESLGLGYSRLAQANPGLIMASISGFGQEGPYARFKAPDIVIQAMGGYMNLVGDLDRAPLRIGVPQSYLHAGNEAATGILIALWHREQTGRGQHVDVAAQESVLWTGFNNYVYWDFKGVNPQRGNVDHTVLVVDQEKHPDFYRCKDGFVIFTPNTGRNGNRTRKFVEWMQEEGAASDFLLNVAWEASLEELAGKPVADLTEKERETLTIRLNERQREIKRQCGAFLLTKTKKELWSQAVAREFLLAPINDVSEVYKDEHFSARGLWQAVNMDGGESPVYFPGAPYKTEITPYVIRGPAPAPGANQPEIWNEERRPPVPTASTETSTEAFKGLKILDFTWVTVGPRAMRYFADHGATIVKVEAPMRYDVGRLLLPFKDGIAGPDRSGWFALYNVNKHGTTIDLTNPAGKELISKLVQWADVLVESFRPGVMKKYGLDYENVQKINPGVIYASTTMFGQTGPYSAFGGYGYHAAAMCGFDDLTGWPDRVPIGAFWAYTDHIAPQYLADAITVALLHRKKTGKGQYIDQSQNESAVHFLGPQVLDYQLNGRVARRDGYRDLKAAPHGTFRCRGNDRWCVIAVDNDEEWRSFCKVADGFVPEKEDRFNSPESRLEHADELEKIIENWTVNKAAEEVMFTCQQAGIAAGVVQTSEDLHRDPQIQYRRHYWNVDHPAIGLHPVDALPFRLSHSPAQLYRREPLLGEHNMHVCAEILGLSDDDFVELSLNGAFGAI